MIGSSLAQASTSLVVSGSAPTSPLRKPTASLAGFLVVSSLGVLPASASFSVCSSASALSSSLNAGSASIKA